MKKRKVIEKKEKFFTKQKTMAYAMGSFIILIMVASALNMWKGETTDEYEYNGMKFIRTEQGFWVAYKGNQQLALAYHPAELENISIPPNIGLLGFSQKIYISSDDIRLNGKAMDYFKRKIGITNQKPYACVEDNEDCADLPLKSCNESTQSQAVVVFKKAEETKVSYENNCLTMEGTNENLIKAIDKLYFILENG